MKKPLLLALTLFQIINLQAQDNLEAMSYESTITDVQPMTGIVLWDDSGNSNTDAISLEYSYMSFDKVIEDSATYDWDYVEDKLDDIASRDHQAIFRFRYIYPGKETTIPQYILDRDDYTELIDKSEGEDTHFADWTCEELKRFTLEFYTKFAERYDDDPRLAFVQVGFGLWAEYHIYDGPNVIGEQFPDKDFQEEFFYHLQDEFENIPWSISIDAADDYYTSFNDKSELKDINFGLFDDSFMHSNHSGYNTTCWNFFDRERYKTSPAGGEFSYYSDYDQQHVLDYPDGPYGTSYETFAENFHITYMIGNDQPSYQTMDRIKEASIASGYKFKLLSIMTSSDSSVFEVYNYGVAPIYYDAYISVDGVRSTESLKLLAPGESKILSVSAGAANSEISIVSDKLVEGQEIQFYGTQELEGLSSDVSYVNQHLLGMLSIFPNALQKDEFLNLSGNDAGEQIEYCFYTSAGKLVESGKFTEYSKSIATQDLEQGIYFIQIKQSTNTYTQKVLVH